MADSNLDVNIGGRDDLTPLLNNLESRIIRFVGFVSSTLATLKVASFPVTASADFERELANVQKTTEFTKNAIGDLADRLKDLSLRMNVSVVDLTKIAAAAGQQGLGGSGVDGIVKFTESVARMASVLDITADEAATNVGKLLNIFHLGVNDTEKIASAFNEVSNNSTANGAQLLDIVRRIGDAAGTVNLQKSLGLAATGIDLGLSPEVVGTSFQSIFIQMRSKASQFAKLLGVDVKTWMTLLQQDGIKALEQYLSALRKLDSQNQAKAINALSGQGRIAGLVNKLVQDTNNTVLNKNLGNADIGYTSGTSALREQQKVLNTFNEQFKILKNSVFSLATETGDVLLPQLTAYVAQLSAGLQSDGFKSFLQAVGQSMLDLVKLIAEAVRWVGQLNVNWENFITVAKVYLGLKLAEAFLGLAARLPLVSSLLDRITASSARVGGAIGNAANESVDGLTRMTNAVRELTAARVAQAEAEANAARAQRVAQAQEAEYLRAARAEYAANRLAQTATANTTAAAQNVANTRTQTRANVSSAVSATRNNIESLQTTLENKRVQAEAATQARIAAIEANYRGQRRVAQIAARDAEIAAEETALARRLRGYDSYYNRQINIARTSGAQLIAQERATRNQLIADAEAAEQRLTQVQVQAEEQRAAARNRASGNRQRMEQADGAARNTRAQADAAAQATDQARQRAFSFGTVIGAVGTAVAKLIGVLSSVFFWFTVVYTVMDQFGLLEKMPGFFQKLTDAIGLTSEATRKEAEQRKKANEEMQKTKKHLDDLKEAYDKLKDSTTGTLDPAKVKAVVENLKSDNAEARQRAIQSVGGAITGAALDSENQKSAGVEAGIKAKDLARQAADLNAQLIAARANYKTLLNSSTAYSGEIKAAGQKIKDLEGAYAAASQASTDYQRTARAGNDAAIQQAAQNQQTIAELVNGLFTDKSAELFQQYVVPIRNAQTALDKLVEARDKAAQKKTEIADTPDNAPARAKAQANIESMQAGINTATDALVKLQTQYAKTRDELLKGTLDAPTRNSILGLLGFSGQDQDIISNINNVLNQQKAAGKKLKGDANPDVKDTAATGDGTFTPNTESEARKMAKILYELKKAQYDAQAALTREQNDQIARLEQQSYDKGLLSMAQYYAERRRLQLSSNDAEIKALNLEAAEAARQRKARAGDPDVKPSELKSFDVTIARLNGQIAVLKEKRNGINSDADNDLQKALEAFEAKVNSAQLNLMDSMGVTDFDLYFARQLDAGSEQYKDFWSQLITEGGEGASELVNQMQNAVKLDALSKVFDRIDESISRSYSSLDLWTSRLALLQQQGIITTAQFEVQSQRYRDKAAASIQASIDADRAALKSLTNAGDTASEQYRKLVQRIDEAQLRLAQLQAQGNQVAQAIQQSLSQGISDALTELTSGRQAKQLSSIQQQVLQDNAATTRRLEDNLAFLQRARSGLISGYQSDQANLDAQIAKTRDQIGSLKEQSKQIRDDTRESMLDLIKRSASAVGISVAKAVQEQAVKNLAQKAMQYLGGTQGGLGGLISGALGNERGSTPMNPLYVQDTSKDVVSASKPLTDNLSALYDKAKDKLGGIFSSITDSLSSVLSSLKDSLGDVFSSLGKSISGAFSGGGAGVSGMLSSAATWFASLFHSGGVVGLTSTPRLATAGMFAHATRYHTGGIAGLAPNEVPAILQKGEEVLTANDPRHRSNAGSGGDTNIQVDVNVEGGQTAVQADSGAARELGRQIATAVRQVIATEKRPGGLLSNG